MQATSALFTADEKASFRQISESLLVSWHVQSILGSKTFTIGVSIIGGNDLIGINPGAVGSPANYKYFDESNYVLSLGWDRLLNMPQGGLTMGLAEAVLDNTSNRFTPRQVGGNSEISTAILPRRPAIINAGFVSGQLNNSIPQFSGLINDQPAVTLRDRQISLAFADYVSYFQNKYMDKVVMFTSEFTDTVIGNLFNDLGMNTAQYNLDPGINLIPFGFFDVGTRFSDAIGQLVEAENGQLFQDEFGVFQFWNRQHFLSSPYNQIQKVISTAMVIDSQITNVDHIVNSIEISANVRTKQQQDIIYSLDATTPQLVAAGTTQDFLVSFADPILALTIPSSGGAISYFIANTLPDGTGSDTSSSISFSLSAQFAQAAKFKITNSTATDAYLTSIVISGRSASVTSNIDYQSKDSSSVTAFQEQILSIDNNFIQSQSWAETYAQMILNDYSNPNNIQRITVRAMPDLQLGDLISWQGKQWRIFEVKASLDVSQGFIQILTLLQQTIQSYFRIGISTIGGSDQISP